MRIKGKVKKLKYILSSLSSRTLDYFSFLTLPFFAFNDALLLRGMFFNKGNSLIDIGKSHRSLGFILCWLNVKYLILHQENNTSAVFLLIMLNEREQENKLTLKTVSYEDY